MEFRILGPLEVIVRRAGARSRRREAARAPRRAAHPSEPAVVPVTGLIDALWEESPPDTARKALQVHVSKLRKRLGRTGS